MIAMTVARQVPLIDRLPRVRGRYREASSLASVTWFRVGGPAEVVFRPADRADLADFLRNKPDDVPVTVIGVGSNLLVRDGGIEGVVLRLGRDFAAIDAEDGDMVCGASALDANVAIAALQAGIGGLEFLSGVPGTIGGALRMNAGAYGQEMKDVLVWAEALDPSGREHRLGADRLGLSYRRSELPDDWILVAARLRGTAEAAEVIERRMAEIQAARSGSQPVRSRTGGSTFKNPPGRKAWQLIDQAGCRGLTLGGAQVSEQHCNFLINTGTATADDLESLGELVRQRVREATGITLEWEIRRIGRKPAGAQVGGES